LLKTAANILSWILHPLLMPTYGIALLFHYSPYLSYSIDESIKLYIYAIVFISTFAVPVLISLFLLRQGMLRSLILNERRERALPFIVTAISFLTGYYILKQLPIPKIFYLFLLGALTSLIIALLINYKWKISLHMIGMGGIIGALFAMSQIFLINMMFPIMLWLLLAGTLGTARLSLDSHKPSEIYIGFATGFLSLFLIIGLLA
jgi:hypothetical protein